MMTITPQREQSIFVVIREVYICFDKGCPNKHMRQCRNVLRVMVVYCYLIKAQGVSAE